jgi:argininosuccinate lyase
MIKTIFGDELSEKVLRFTSKEDLELDLQYFFLYDVYVYIAHNIMLFKEGYLKVEELDEILKGLKEILVEFPHGLKKDFLKEGIEDVHSLIEFLLKEKIGEIGLKSRFNLSRNDEVATLQQMKLREEAIEIALKLLDFCKTLLEKAEEHCEVIMPAFTHSQVAQPMTMGYYWLSIVDGLLRNIEDLKSLFSKLNLSPLGACAITGAPAIEGVGIDRELVAKLLGFDGIIENTIDAISSRGENAYRFLHILSNILAFHVSKLCEDIVNWSTLKMINIGKSFVSGSSLIPQKRNPDVAELVRAKGGRIIGNVMKVASICKSLPMGYSRDFQEIKPILIESIDVTKESIDIVNGMIKAIEPDEAVMIELLKENWATATDLVSAIAIKFDIPYREAYFIVKEFVKGNSLAKAFREVMGKTIVVEESEIADWLDLRKSIERRAFVGGLHPTIVKETVKDRLEKVRELEHWFENKAKVMKECFARLNTICEHLDEFRTFIKNFVK